MMTNRLSPASASIYALADIYLNGPPRLLGQILTLWSYTKMGGDYGSSNTTD